LGHDRSSYDQREQDFTSGTKSKTLSALSLCRLPRASCTQRIQLQCTQNLGWSSWGCLQKGQRRVTPSQHQHPSLSRMAAEQRLPQQQTRCQTLLLRLQSGFARSSRVPSITENLMCLGHYIGPISYQDLEALVGPFQSSPFSIIPKPGKIGKYCNVQNYSFPIYPSPSFPNQSINSLVDSDSFPTTWGTFSLVLLLIHCLSPGSQLATRDVAEAYCMIPLHHSQWPATVVRLDEFSFAIDTSVCFGVWPISWNLR
jgi:hypothetical protein